MEKTDKSRRSLILVMIRVILGTEKVVLIRLGFGRSAQVRSLNCGTYWLLVNMYSEISGFGLGKVFILGECFVLGGTD